jgi:KDO2-lipid IV(A) lauroyltransferase
LTTQQVKQAPQAPKVGRLGGLLGRFHVTGLFWYRFHVFGVRVAPQWIYSPTIRLFSIVFWLSLIQIRRAIASNLEAVLGPCGWVEKQRRIYRTMHSFAWCLTERYERLATDAPAAIEVENRDAWSGAIEGETGVIVVTAHIGNWEFGSALPSTREGYRVHLVREEELDPRAQEFIQRMLRERMGELYTTHFAGDPTLGIRLVEALSRGECVALQADRPRSGGRVVRAELFGRPFELPLGPLAMARAAGAPLLPVFVLRTGRREYRVCLREPIHVHATDDRRADLADAAARLSRAIEWAVREEPHQWFCFRALWDDEETGQSASGTNVPSSPVSTSAPSSATETR